ncbi:hypothetical protein [Xanthomonas sp. WHRI 6106]|uniref:hypothetical protein n=1 Tax=Xanthomonas sp. WHRI 6106 TaxID=3161566 RepID=UPI0032E891DE
MRAAPTHTPAALQSIDALRGVVMVLMLLDHLRETWFLHVPVADPIDATTALPGLYYARLAASLCAPVFVALTGISAYLFWHQAHPGRDPPVPDQARPGTDGAGSAVSLRAVLGRGQPDLLAAGDLVHRHVHDRAGPVDRPAAQAAAGHAAEAIWGPTQGTVFGVDHYGWVLAWYVVLIIPLYLPTAWFSRPEAARRDVAWLKYF